MERIMDTPRRDPLLRPDVRRSRRSDRQALAIIPNASRTNVSYGPEIMEFNTNAFTRRSLNSQGSAPSPDELVIQKRGRRRTIVWSPDTDACKRNNLFSLSSRDRTPVKTPTGQTSMHSGNTHRKRLYVGDNDAEMTTPEKKEKPSTTKQFAGSLVNGLRGLSHEQLVKMLMDLVSLQEDGLLTDNLHDVILKKMPIADIQQFKEKLTALRQNVCGSLISSNFSESAYNQAYFHLDNFEKALKEFGQNLLNSEHWTAVIQYVFAAWTITKDLPEWKDQRFESTTQECYKNLVQFCIKALQTGIFAKTTLQAYHEKFQTMVADCEDVKICLQLVTQAST